MTREHPASPALRPGTSSLHCVNQLHELQQGEVTPMARSRYAPCPEPACHHLLDRRTGECDAGHAKAKRQARQRLTDAQRPTARQRGYDTQHELGFRRPVLARDPVCVIPGCDIPSQHADHHPVTRAELVRRGMDPNDPKHGRGLCASHHAAETARHDGGYGNPRTA